MKTKILWLVVAMVAVLAVFVSCGPKDPVGPDDENLVNTSGITYDYDWDKTEIIVKLTEHTNNDELSSGCRRYYAGQDPTAFDDIDDDVQNRNLLANKVANVKATYKYIGEKENAGWGENIKTIHTEINSGSQNIPDIYCNFAYDMTCASLRGCFANLLQEEGNYFRFTEDDYTTVIDDPAKYFDSSVGEGFFYQYMRSLSLTPDTKLYCLASDYTLDVMRAFLVMPVNVSLINAISLENLKDGSQIKDVDGDKDHDIDDFYKLVWAGDWNYSTLAEYAFAAYQPGSDTTKPQTDLSDPAVGLALGSGGLTASGMLYTTSVTILEKQNDGSYKYPTSNTDLNSFATALYDLVHGGANRGICVVSSNSDIAAVPGAKTTLQAIRSRFASNNVLFGGVVAVGSLEDKIYQDMKGNGGQGFGVVPVPLYKDAEGEEYKTLVHNLARIVSISKVSTKFSQCSAFLDYLSRCSDKILNNYYDHHLTAAVSGGRAGAENVKMLNYIRNHVNNCFDKTFEDAVCSYGSETDPEALGTRFHFYISSQNYKVSSFSTVYETVLKPKQGYFTQLWDAWNELD